MAEGKTVILSIEGNIGAGKTTFLKIIRQSLELSFEIIEEPVAEWKKLTGGTSDQEANLLQLFYEDPTRWGYAFQSYCYFTRMREWMMMKQSLKPNVYLFERSIHSDKNIFAKNAYQNGVINDVEWKAYNYWFDLMNENVGMTYDGVVYLKVNPEKCFERIGKRGRPEETGIPMEYLKQIDQKHEDWIKNQTMPILVLEWEDEFDNNPEKQKEIGKRIKDWIKEKLY